MCKKSAKNNYDFIITTKLYRMLVAEVKSVWESLLQLLFYQNPH